MKSDRLGFFFGIFYRLSLIKKFILAYVMIIAIPVAILGINAIDNAAASAREGVYKNESFYLQDVRNAIGRNVEICVRAAQLVLNNRNLIQFITEERTHTTEEFIDFKNGPLRNFESILNINPDIYEIRFFMKQPEFDEIWPSIYDIARLGDSSWVKKVWDLDGKTYWRFNHPEETIVSGNTPEEVVSVYTDVSGMDIKHKGVLEVNMRADMFMPELNSTSSQGNSILCLVDSLNTLYAGKDETLLKEFSSREELVNYLVSGRKKQEGNFTFNGAKGQYLVVYSYVKELDAFLFKVSSLKELNAEINRTLVTMLLAFIGGFALLVLVSYFITRALLRKTSNIISAMRKVQEGNLNIDIPVEGNDEISEVAYHFKKMMAKVNELIYIVARKETATKEAEIKALQSQINKHFIYNVLEAIKMMAEINSQYEIAATVNALGRLMRYSLSWSKNYVTIKDEVGYIRDYISLLNIRYDFEVKLVENIGEGFMHVEILKMTLQPIVENSFKHGLEPLGRGGTIRMTAFSEDETLIVEVTDDGAGMSEEQLKRLRNHIEGEESEPEIEEKTGGIGLKNVNERIRLFYGRDFGLRVFSQKGAFTRVELRIPYEDRLYN